jgi:serine/threonine-protein kinase
VAIKVIAPELARTAGLRERFLREARTVARLRHPHVVAVHAAGDADGLLWFAMELVPGESLRERLAREGRLPVRDGTVVLRDLARALAAAHAQGVVHRDVKPENVLLDAETGRAMLTDFGVAQALTARATRA